MKMTDDDIDLIESLTNPEDSQNNTYQHDFQINQKILGMLISDRHFLVQSLDLIKPEYFEDEGHRLLCSIVLDHFQKYNKLPSKAVIQNEMKERRKNSEHIYQYLGEMESVLADYIPGMDSRDYLMDKIVEFAKEQGARCAVSKTMETLKRKPNGAWNKIWDIWREALTIDKGHDIGLDYLNTLEERYDRMAAEDNNRKEIFTSGFPNLNDGVRRGIDSLLTAGGLCRGELAAYVGLSGSGKSIALINAAAQNLMQGKKVCYITLEMAQDKIAKRFDALLSGEALKSLFDHKKMVFDAIRTNFHHEEDKRRLVIKHYPGGTADVNTFRAYLSQLSLFGFVPDMLVVDYIGELKDIAGMKTYESRQMLVRDLRALVAEENIFGLTAMQANRKGREVNEQFAGSIDDDAVADAFGQMRPLDAAWSLNKEEGSSNVGWMFVMKHRDGISKRQIFYELDSNTLQMREITSATYKERVADLRAKKGKIVDDVLVPIEVKPAKGVNDGD